MRFELLHFGVSPSRSSSVWWDWIQGQTNGAWIILLDNCVETCKGPRGKPCDQWKKPLPEPTAWQRRQSAVWSAEYRRCLDVCTMTQLTILFEMKIWSEIKYHLLACTREKMCSIISWNWLNRLGAALEAATEANRRRDVWCFGGRWIVLLQTRNKG